MEYWLTQKGRVECLHPKPGKVNVATGQSFLSIDGGYVNVKADTAKRRITGCRHPNSTNSKPCKKTLDDNGAYSKLVRISGKPPCLQSITGVTSSVPISSYRVAETGQTFVRSD